MKIRYYKTLKGLFKSFGVSEIDYLTYQQKAMWNDKNNELCYFRLSKEADYDAKKLFASVLTDNEAEQIKYVKRMEYYVLESGELQRLVLVLKNKKIRGEFRALECSISEVNQLKRLFENMSLSLF